MASAFNLTAQINLQGPANLKPVVAQIKRSLSGITTDINIKFDSKAAKGVDNLTDRISILNRVMLEASRNSQTLNASLSSLGNSINQLGNISKVNSNINKTTQSITSTTKAIQGATSEIAEFGKQSALAVRRFAAFSVVTSSVFALINAVNAGAKAFVDFDQQLIKLRQTTGAGSVAIKDLESEITNLAVNLGVSSEKLAQVAIVLAQAGLTANQTKQALSALAKTELTPSFDDITQTTEGAIAAMRQFNIETGDLEKALGSINAVAAAFAVESSDIIAAIQRAGGAFAASSRGVSDGVDALNEFIAVFTSVRATTRESAETIATGLRTIFTRIQRGSTIEFLREFNVELTDLDGKFVGPFEAVKRLSEVLNTLDPRDLRFSQIVEELGGFRQIGKVIPLIQQFATAQEALRVAQRGQGSLAQAQATAQLALANQIAKVREEFLALIREVGQSQTFQALFKTVLGLTSGLIKLGGVLKPILPLLAILGAVKGGSALTQYAGGFLGGLKKTQTQGSQGSNATGSSLLTNQNAPERTAATERANSFIQENTNSLKTLTTAVQNLTQAVNSRNNGTTGFARGGVVPGSGNRDTVPAMLTPGEFVIRKKAVEAIGTSNLHKMNRYANGGFVSPNDAMSAWEKSRDLELAHIGDVLPVKPEQLASYLQRPSSSQKNISGPSRSVKFDRQLEFMGISSNQYSQLSNADLQNIIDRLKLSQAEPLLVSLPKSTNQSLRNKSTGVIKNTLAQWMSSNPSSLLSGSRRNVDRVSVSKLETGFTIDDFANILAGHIQQISKDIIYDTDINSVKDSLGNVLNQETLNNLASRSDLIWQNIIPPIIGEKRRTQERQEGTQRLFDGGFIQKFGIGGGVKELAQSKGLSIEEAILQQIKELGDIKGVKSLLKMSGGDRSLDSLLRAGNIRAGKNLPMAIDYIDEAMGVARDSGIAQSKAIEAATKVAIVGLQPFDKSDMEGPLDIGGKSVVIYIQGLAKQYAEAVSKMRDSISGSIRAFAENIQSQAIFGGSNPLRLDFDETLVSGADIYDSKGNIDIAGYNDLDRVKDALKNGRLTPLGQKVKELLAADPSFANRISVLTARPQNNAKLLSQRLGELGLPIPSEKITGTSGGGSKKAAALKDTERLIDDNLENIKAARGKNNSAIQYQPIRDLSDQEKAATGFANIEGSVLEATLAALGAKGGIIQNRAIDYSMGLGPAAQYFPGIGPDWPTEVKRTLDSNSIGKAKEEFTRFFSENSERFAQGGAARYSWRENKGIMDSFNSTRSRYDVFEHSDKDPAKIIYSGSFDDVFKFLQQKRNEQETKKMAIGGGVQDTVPALLTPGEFVINKKAAQKIGSAKLNRLNKADKLQGFNKGGSVGGIQRFASGGFAESQEFARALKLMVEVMNTGESAIVAAKEAAKTLEFSLPEAAKFLTEAADKFAETGDLTVFGANDSGKKALSDTFDSSGALATMGSIEALADSTQKAADVLSLFREEAGQSGVSLQKFQANLKEQLANRALDIQGQRRSTRLDLRKQILKGKVSDLSNEDVVSSLRDNLTSQLTTLSGPSADPNAINAAVEQLINDISDSSKTFDDLKNSSSLLTQAFDTSIDRSQALSTAQEEFSDQLGGLTDAVKVTIDELNAIDYQKSGQAAADFGFVGNNRPGQALAFKNSRFGGGLLNTAKSFQESAFLDKIPLIGKKLGGLGQVLEGLPGPIGSAVKAIGGLPGALAAVTSMIGSEVIPQLAKTLNMGDNETLAGVGGALAQGGSIAASLGTLGNQFAGPIGGMIGVIGGAIAGGIKGFFDSFQTKALENSLARLTTQTEKVNKAFEYLSKTDNNLNLGNAQKETANLEANIADLGSKAERTLLERGKDAGVSGIIGTTIGAIVGLAADIAAAGLTGGYGTVTGAVVGGAIGTSVGAFSGPTDLDNEALQAQLKAIETYVEGLNKLAERRINLKSLDDLNQVVTEYQDFNKNIDAQVKDGTLTPEQATVARNNYNEQLGRTRSTAVEEAQRGALIASGRVIDQNRSVSEQIAGDVNAQQIAERAALLAAEAAAMDELKKKYGDNNDLINKEKADKDKLIKRGFELLGVQEYQSRAAARLALVTKQVAVETESLIDIYNKVLAGIQAFNSDIANSQIAMEQSVGVLTGNASMGRVDRRNEEVLRNPRGYDEASFNKALESISKLAGGGEQADKLTSSIRARKALEDRLPELLRNTTSKDVDSVAKELRTILKDAQVDNGTASQLIDEITQNLERETSGRQGKSFEELSRDLPALQDIIQSTEKAQQVGIALEEAKNNALEQVNKNLDQFSSLMQKSAEWTRKATEIMLQGALELDKVLGKGLSLERLNEPFRAEIEAMTAPSNGGIGTTDPVTIADNIRKARAEEERLRQEIDARSGIEQNAQGKSELEGLKLAQEEVGRASRDAYAALEKLATNGSNAANVLAKIDERRQIGKNAGSFLEKVFTQTGEEAFNMIQSFNAFQDALNGNLNFGNQQERKLAFEGMNTLLPMLTGPVAAKVQAKMLQQMLRGSGVDLNQQLIPAMGDQAAMTYQNILDLIASPEMDPGTQALIAKYEEAIGFQKQAADELAKLYKEAARNETLVNIQNILEQLRDRLPGIITDVANRPPANPAAAAAANPRPQVVANNNAASSPTRGALIAGAAPAVNAANVQVQANNAAVQANQPPQINGPALAGNNQEQPLLGANNLNNITLPVLDQIAVSIPKLDNQLLNLINAVGSLNTNIVSLKDLVGAINSPKQEGNNNDNNNTFGQQVNAFGVSVTNFGVSVTNFGVSIKTFTSYVDKLSNIKFPEKITMGGSYTLDVRVSGAAAFEALENKTKQIIDTEIANKLDELQMKIAKATGFAFDTNRRTV